MLRLPLWAVQLIGALLVLTPPITAVIGFDRYSNEMLAAIAILFFVAAALFSVFYYRTRKMPVLLAGVNLSVAVIIPLLIQRSIQLASVDSQSSWYVSGVGALLAITAIRGQQPFSWIGASVLSAQVLVWGGVGALFNTGLAGALALVFAANALSYALARIEFETKSYLDRTIEAEAAAAIESAVLAERSRRMTGTLRLSYPLLEKITRGQIDEDLRLEAKLLEAELRDGIRGRDLIDANLQEAIRAARLRGIDVTVLDDGGLVALPENDRATIRQRFSAELDQISSGRVTIRATRRGKINATFVASRPGTSEPDVFLKL